MASAAHSHTTSAHRTNPKRHRDAQLAQPYELSQAEEHFRQRYIRDSASDGALDPQMNKAEQSIPILKHIAKLAHNIKELGVQHTRELKKVQDESQAALQNHRLEEDAWLRKEQDFLKQENSNLQFRADLARRISAAGKTQGIDLTNCTSIQAMFDEFARNSTSARQQSVSEMLQNERNVQAENENEIKQSLKGIYTTCNALYNESYGVISSVSNMALFVTRMAVELEQFKNDRVEINKSIDGLIEELVPGNRASLLESNTRVKFSSIKPAIEIAIRNAKTQVHTRVSSELQQGLRALALVPFVDGGDTIHAVSRFASRVCEDHKSKKDANDELLRSLTERALLQEVALSSDSTVSLQECLPHYLEQVSAELDTLRNDRDSLRNSSTENAGIVSQLRILIDGFKKLVTGAISAADKDRPAHEILDECVKAATLQLQDLRAVDKYIDLRVSELQPDSAANSTADKVKLCVDGLRQARDALAKGKQDLTASIESVQTVVDAAIQVQGDTTDETLPQRINSYVQRMNKRVEVSESDARAARAALTKAAVKYGAEEDPDPEQQCSALHNAVTDVVQAKQDIIDGAISYIQGEARLLEIESTHEALDDHIKSLVEELKKKVEAGREKHTQLDALQSEIDTAGEGFGLEDASPTTVAALAEAARKQAQDARNETAALKTRLQSALTDHAVSLGVQLGSNTDVCARLTDLCTQVATLHTERNELNKSKLDSVLDKFVVSLEAAAGELSATMALSDDPRPATTASSDELGQWIGNQQSLLTSAMATSKANTITTKDATIEALFTLVAEVSGITDSDSPAALSSSNWDDASSVLSWATACRDAFEHGVKKNRGELGQHVAAHATDTSALIKVFTDFVSAVWQTSAFSKEDWPELVGTDVVQVRTWAWERARTYNREFNAIRRTIHGVRVRFEELQEATVKMAKMAVSKTTTLLTTMGETGEITPPEYWEIAVVRTWLDAQGATIVGKWEALQHTADGFHTAASKILNAAQQSFASTLNMVSDQVPFESELSVDNPDQAVTSFLHLPDKFAIDIQALSTVIDVKAREHLYSKSHRDEQIQILRNQFRYLANDLGFDTRQWPDTSPLVDNALVESYFYERRRELSASWELVKGGYKTQIAELHEELKQAAESAQRVERIQADHKKAVDTVAQLVESHNAAADYWGDKMALIAGNKVVCPPLSLDASRSTRESILEWSNAFIKGNEEQFAADLATRDKKKHTELVRKLAPHVRNLGFVVQRDMGKLERQLRYGDAPRLHVHQGDSPAFLISNVRNMQGFIEQAVLQMRGGLRGLHNNTASLEWALRKANAHGSSLELELASAESDGDALRARYMQRNAQARRMKGTADRLRPHIGE